MENKLYIFYMWITGYDIFNQQAPEHVLFFITLLCKMCIIKIKIQILFINKLLRYIGKEIMKQ